MDVRKFVIMLFLAFSFIKVNGENPVIFVDSSDIKYAYKIASITGPILAEILPDSLWEDFFKNKKSFKLGLFVDKDGKIESYISPHNVIPDLLVRKFINILKQRHQPFYVLIGLDSYNNRDSFLKAIKSKEGRYVVQFLFPSVFLLRKIKQLSGDTVPSREGIIALCKEYIDIPLKTSKDYGITKKDY